MCLQLEMGNAFFRIFSYACLSSSENAYHSSYVSAYNDHNNDHSHLHLHDNDFHDSSDSDSHSNIFSFTPWLTKDTY